MSRHFKVRRLYFSFCWLLSLYLWEACALLSLFGTLARRDLLFEPGPLLSFSCRLFPALLVVFLLLDLSCALFLGKPVCSLTENGVLRGNRLMPWEDIRSILWQSHSLRLRGPWGQAAGGDRGSILLGRKRRMTLPHLPLWAAFLLRRRVPGASLCLGGPWPLLLFSSQLFIFGTAALFTFYF